ncbi:MAG TPA: hypothetical protein VI389_02915, partial [Geobacteraceae bacterium]
MRWNHNLALVLMLLLSFNALPALAIDIDYDKLAPVRGLGINGRIIAFSTGNDRPGSLTHAFNLGTMSLDDEWLRTVSFKKIEPA